MIVHLVLFTPREDLADGERASFASALDRALSEIPSVRRCRVGRRVITGAMYEQGVRDAYEFCGILEFDDRAGLEEYLSHPAHADLGRLFYTTSARTFVHDFETVTTAADALARFQV